MIKKFKIIVYEITITVITICLKQNGLLLIRYAIMSIDLL